MAGLLGWRVASRTGGFLTSPGTISSGGCQVVEVRPLRRVADAKVSPSEERLVFDSRWGRHSLKLMHGGATLVEENTSGTGGRVVHKWTRVEKEPPPSSKDGSPLKLW